MLSYIYIYVYISLFQTFLQEKGYVLYSQLRRQSASLKNAERVEKIGKSFVANKHELEDFLDTGGSRHHERISV